MVVALLLGGILGGVMGYRVAERGPVTTLGADRGDGPALLAQAPPDSVAAVVQQVLPSVVTIRTEQGRERGVGSGFVVSADGHILTNEHVVSAAAGPVTVVFYDGVETPATLVGKDPESDIAVLQVSRTDLTPVRLGDSDAVSVGDPVLAFGSPLALDNTVTSGIVSAVDRPIESGAPGGVTRYYAAIQTDAAVNQGNSGGPLVDAAGRVIGINSVIKSVAAGGAAGGSIGLAFAIPVRQAERVAAQIIDTGEANRTVIGAEVAPAEGGDDAGVRLGDVTPQGPADRAGLRAGDVVTRLNGRPLYAPGDLVALVRKQPAGQVVTVHYRRGETEQSATVTLTAERG
jgi:putative serine protease PepD